MSEKSAPEENLTREAKAIDAAYAKIRKCQELPSADLAGKYAKAYAKLLGDTTALTEKFLTTVVLDGWHGMVTEPAFKYAGAMFDIKMGEPGGMKARQQAEDAMRLGDVCRLHLAALALRDMMRETMTTVGANADPAFEMALVRM